MKTRFFLFVAAFGFAFLQAQTVPFVSVYNINYVSPTDLANCIDASSYLGDTVRTRGIVMMDGNLSEVASSSVQGGARPFIFIVDTAMAGAPGPWKGLEVLGVYSAGGALVVPPTFTQVVAGDVVEIKGIISAFANSNQIALLDANSFSVVGSASAPTSVVVPLASLNDPNRVNNVQTGEQWEGSYIELQNVTVTEVLPFSGNRISFNVIDGNGNKINVSDRYLAQKLPSWTTVNTNSPQTTGSFVPPAPGTFYTSLKGVVRHDANGCLGGTGRGYELDPFAANHYVIGFAPPYFSNVDRDPFTPTSNQSPEITLNVTDSDGTVDSLALCWTDNAALTPNQFPKFAMTLTPGTTDEFTYSIPNRPDGTFIRYFIYAKDNDGNVSYYPSTPTTQPQPNLSFYTVRNNGLKVYDIQLSLQPDGNSTMQGRTVTTKGYVTASAKLFDLGFMYIQDDGGAEWSGIWCVGTGSSDFFREEEVQVTGVVEEYFGMTRINLSAAAKTGNRKKITPVVVDPSDSAAYANFGWEKWEGVLVRYQDPQNQKLWINQENLGFGDYGVSNSPTAPVSKTGRILAGRQSTTAYSSLYVSLIIDTTTFNYTTLDGLMNVPAVVVQDTMNMDAVEGIMFYAFSQYRLLPRNNDDFIGINVVLDSTNLPTSPIGITEFTTLEGVKIYPNPAQNWVKISLLENEDFTVHIYDINGKCVATQNATGNTVVDANLLANGLYIISLKTKNGQVHYSKLMVNK